MKYVSIDIETTGLDPEECQVIQIGAVIEDTANVVPLDELPKFNCLVEHQLYKGSAFAINLNQEIMKKLAKLEGTSKDERLEIKKAYNIFPEGLVAKSFAMWLHDNDIIPEPGSTQVRITAAGKNFASFDKVFLQKLTGWKNHVQIRQRIIDPAILFMHWTEDPSPPNLTVCMQRAGLTEEVTHDALQDAIDVVRVIRAATQDYTRTF